MVYGEELSKPPKRFSLWAACIILMYILIVYSDGIIGHGSSDSNQRLEKKVECAMGDMPIILQVFWLEPTIGKLPDFWVRLARISWSIELLSFSFLQRERKILNYQNYAKKSFVDWVLDTIWIGWMSEVREGDFWQI